MLRSLWHARSCPDFSTRLTCAQIVEDVPIVLSSEGGIYIADFDVEERINSAFARRNWTYRVQNQVRPRDWYSYTVP